MSEAVAHEAIEHPALRAAVEWIHAHDPITLHLQTEVTEIPAPPFGEGRRAAWMADRFRERGLDEVRLDEIGNVLGWRPGTASTPALVVSAHLDTVFPEGTDVRVSRQGDVLRAPGISDDGRGLAALLMLADALDRGAIATRAPLLFVATVGEEGEGNLRGAKHLLARGGTGAGAGGFISLDGAGIRRVVSKGVGSHRIRARITGRGGHSWVDFGVPNPVHALAAAIARWSLIELPADPITTLTVARWGGGTAINAIPCEAWADVDLRSEEPESLARLVAEVGAVLERSVADTLELSRRSDRLEAHVEVLGARPAGGTDPECALVKAAIAATRAVGEEPELVASSTDANVAMSLGIPAVTLGAGGDAGLAHTLEEWYRNERGPEGVVRALLTVAWTAGLA